MRDHRKTLWDLLHRYQPLNQEDDRQRATILAFVEKNTDCFERTNITGHITGSAWVVDAAGQQVLLTHHKKLGKWLQLGGHVDGNPDVLAAALREAKEESGLDCLKPLTAEIFDIDLHLIPAREQEPAHYHYDIRFAVCAGEGIDAVLSAESNALAWVRMDQLENFSTEPSLLRMREKWLTKIKGEVKLCG